MLFGLGVPGPAETVFDMGFDARVFVVVTPSTDLHNAFKKVCKKLYNKKMGKKVKNKACRVFKGGFYKWINIKRKSYLLIKTI